VLYRAFAPRPGLHPWLGAHDPLVLDWEHGGKRVRIELHGWNPRGGAYDGLPADDEDARRRRSERVVVAPGSSLEVRSSRATGFLLDLRQADAPSLHPPIAPYHAIVV
jgi:hypothetical protein